MLVPKVTAIVGDSFLPVSDGTDEISEKSLATSKESVTATLTGIEIATVIDPVKIKTTATLVQTTEEIDKVSAQVLGTNTTKETSFTTKISIRTEIVTVIASV